MKDTNVYYNDKPTVYYYKKAGIIAGLLNCVIGQEDHVLTNEELDADLYKKELYKDTLIYIGKSPLMAGYPLEDTSNPGYIRLATRVELVEMGKDELHDGEKIVNHVIITVKKPNDFAKWNKEVFTWETDFATLPDGWKVSNRELQILQYINSPNVKAKWNKVNQVWETDINDLTDGEKLLGDGTIEIVEKPLDDNTHRYEWNKETWVWENVITERELDKYFYTIIEALKVQCMNGGFVYQGYQQKCRLLDMNWITQRMNQTRDDGLMKDQINLKYELINGTTKDKLMKVAWVFDHNEILLLDILDFKQMFDMGAEFSQAVYTVEEVLKSSPRNLSINLASYRRLVQSYCKICKVYMGDNVSSDGPQNTRINLRRVRRSTNAEENIMNGHEMNPAHELGLSGVDVMHAGYYQISLEEMAESKYNKNADPLDEKQ